LKLTESPDVAAGEDAAKSSTKPPIVHLYLYKSIICTYKPVRLFRKLTILSIRIFSDIYKYVYVRKKNMEEHLIKKAQMGKIHIILDMCFIHMCLKIILGLIKVK